MDAMRTSGRVAGGLMLGMVLMGAGCATTRHTAPAPLPEKRNAAMTTTLHTAVNELVALGLASAPALASRLGVTLTGQDSGQGWQRHIASGGQLGPVALAQVELRSPPAGQAGSAVLLLQLAQPHPFDPLQWPGAQPSPPRPDAPDAPTWWELPLHNSRVVLGMDAGQQAIVTISVRQVR